jgi:hypothetical protein
MPAPVIHRLPSGLHLLGTGNGLFLMAEVSFSHVIYYIIAKQMDTLHNTNPARNVRQIRERRRLILTLTGIMTAIICSLVFMHDSHATGQTKERLQFGKGSKNVPIELRLGIKKFEVGPAMSFLR